MLPETLAGSLYKTHAVAFENCRCAWNRNA